MTPCQCSKRNSIVPIGTVNPAGEGFKAVESVGTGYAVGSGISATDGAGDKTMRYERNGFTDRAARGDEQLSQALMDQCAAVHDGSEEPGVYFVGWIVVAIQGDGSFAVLP